MIDRCTQPGVGGVTGVTLRGGGDMGGRFTRGRAAIMTAGAGAGDRQVVNIRVGPNGCCVAVIAGVGRRDMGR